jgi:hypothetical protein
MLYSISVPEKTLPGGTAAIFKIIFALSEPLLFICGGLFSLKKMPKQLMIQLNQLALGGFVQKIRITKGGNMPVRVVSLFLPAYYADQQDSPQVKDSSSSRRE